jgi:hypothetical protein
LKKLEKDHSEKFKRNQVQRKRCKWVFFNLDDPLLEEIMKRF